MSREGILGVLTVGGSPGKYSLRKGLTGPEIASGSAEGILRALASELRNEDGSAVEILTAQDADC